MGKHGGGRPVEARLVSSVSCHSRREISHPKWRGVMGSREDDSRRPLSPERKACRNDGSPASRVDLLATLDGAIGASCPVASVLSQNRRANVSPRRQGTVAGLTGRRRKGSRCCGGSCRGRPHFHSTRVIQRDRLHANRERVRKRTKPVSALAIFHNHRADGVHRVLALVYAVLQAEQHVLLAD